VGILDKAKRLLGKHDEQAKDVVEKVADVVDDKTGGKHSEKIDDAATKAKEQIDKLADG
jgi:hypothetical protein